MMTEDHEVFVRIEVLQPVGDVAHRDMRSALNPAQGQLFGFAHIEQDQFGVLRRAPPGNVFDGDLKWVHH